MKRLLTAFTAVAITVVALPMFAAFEAHVVNVTATINNALSVPLDSLDFGNVFPQEVLDKTFDVSLSDSFVSQATFGPELLVNGDFETPIVTNAAGWDIFPSGTAGLGWSVDWAPGQLTTFGGENRPVVANLELHNNVIGWAHSHGNQHSELDSDWGGPNDPLNVSGEPALVNIYQNIPTTGGKKYLLTYNFAARPSTDATENVLNVVIDGSVVQTKTLAATSSQPNWFNYSYEFTAANATTKVEFDGGGVANSLGDFLDNVSLKQETGNEGVVTYMIRQKPKCLAPDGSHPQVTENVDGHFVCPNGSTEMPLLCPYLSKHEVTGDPTNVAGAAGDNDSAGINSFHGLPGVWTEAVTEATQVTGALNSSVGDISDTWDIDLHAPCFAGECAQDWPDFVHAQSPDADPVAYENDPANKGITMGCDLWVEVTGINGQTNCTPTPGGTFSVVSDNTNTVTETAANAVNLVLTPVEIGAYKANVPGANWIWSTDPVAAPTDVNDTKTFNKTFNVVGTVTSASIDIGADNWYDLYVNGVLITSQQGPGNDNHFGNVVADHYVINNLVPGANTIKVVATNEGVGGSNPGSNPAALIYKLTYSTAPVQCAN